MSTRRKTGRRPLAVVVLALTVAFGVAACGGGGDEGGGGGEAGGKPSGTITVWAMGVEGEKLGQLAKDFEAKNPDVKVKVTPIAWEVAHDKILTAIAGGKTPDASLIGTTWMGEFARAGALDQTPDDIDLSGFFEGAKDSVEIDGTPYGVPWYVETRVLYYRKDLAKKAGITKPPESWEELKAMAEALKSKAGAKYGIALAPNNWQEFMPFVWQDGGDVMNDDQTQFTLDSPKVVEALTYYQSFFKDGLTASSVPEGFDVTQGFAAGTHPMFFSGPWHMGLISDAGLKPDQWAIAVMPKKESRTSFVGGGDLAVFKGSKNRDAAWAFVKYLSQPDVQAKWYGITKDLPAVQSAWDKGTLSTDSNLKVFKEQLGDAKSPPTIPKWEQVAQEAINTGMEKATTGGTAPPAAAKEMQSKAESVGTGV